MNIRESFHIQFIKNTLKYGVLENKKSTLQRYERKSIEAFIVCERKKSLSVQHNLLKLLIWGY